MSREFEIAESLGGDEFIHLKNFNCVWRNEDFDDVFKLNDLVNMSIPWLSESKLSQVIGIELNNS